MTETQPLPSHRGPKPVRTSPPPPTIVIQKNCINNIYFLKVIQAFVRMVLVFFTCTSLFLTPSSIINPLASWPASSKQQSKKTENFIRGRGLLWTCAISTRQALMRQGNGSSCHVHDARTEPFIDLWAQNSVFYSAKKKQKEMDPYLLFFGPSDFIIRIPKYRRKCFRRYPLPELCS